MGNRTYTALIILGVMWLAGTAAASTPPGNFSFEGVLAISGTPVTGSSPVTFQIFDPTGSCLIYEESRTLTLPSDGAFSVLIGPGGGGTRNTAGDGNASWARIFSNDGAAIRSIGANCASGNTAAAGSARKLRVTVNGVVLSPDFTISAVPFATTAETLQSKVPADFLNISTNITQTRAESLFTPASYDKLMSFSSNGSGLDANGTRIVNLVSPTSANDAATKLYCDTNVGGKASSGLSSLSAGDNGKILQWNGSQWVATPNASSIPSQSGNSGKFLTTDGTTASWAVTTIADGSVTPLKIGPSPTVGKIPIVNSSATAMDWLSCSVGETITWNASFGFQCTSGVTLPANYGSASAPGYAFMGDSSMGMFRAATSELGFSTGGSERVRINGSGNMGIGVSSPATRLAVGGIITTHPATGSPSDTGAVAFMESSSNGTDSVTLRAPSSVSTNVVYTLPQYDGAYGELLQTDGAGNLSWVPAPPASSIMASPGASPTSPTIQFGSMTGMYAPTSNTVAFSTNGTERMRINTSGKMGIGTTAPQALLHVEGGAIVGSTPTPTASTTLDFSTGNTQVTTASCGTTFNLYNLKKGTEYFLVVRGGGVASCMFQPYEDTGSTMHTFYYVGGNPSVAVSGAHLLLKIYVADNYAYIYHNTVGP